MVRAPHHPFTAPSGLWVIFWPKKAGATCGVVGGERLPQERAFLLKDCAGFAGKVEEAQV